MENKDILKIGFTIGDINGIGPELILKTFAEPLMMKVCIPVIYGSSKIFSFYRKNIKLPEYQFNYIKSANQAGNKIPNLINLWTEEVKIEPGVSTNTAGKYAFWSLKQAVQDLKTGAIDALVTLPINKNNIQQNEFRFSGHTEYLAHETATNDYLMLLIHNGLRVGTVTGHIPLEQVSKNISVEKIVGKAKTFIQTLKQDFRIEKPKIALLGLNPHNGDNGLMGTEEKNIIIPAIENLKQFNYLVFGPFAADGFFGSGNYMKFDGILAMYHDQGLIPFKTLAYGSGVNFTAGLPIIRTSPDHGVAYDIAGKGIANEQSLRDAIYAAIDIYQCRKEYKMLTKNPLPINKTNKDEKKLIE